MEADAAAPTGQEVSVRQLDGAPLAGHKASGRGVDPARGAARRRGSRGRQAGGDRGPRIDESGLLRLRPSPDRSDARRPHLYLRPVSGGWCWTATATRPATSWRGETHWWQWDVTAWARPRSPRLEA